MAPPISSEYMAPLRLDRKEKKKQKALVHGKAESSERETLLSPTKRGGKKLITPEESLSLPPPYGGGEMVPR